MGALTAVALAPWKFTVQWLQWWAGIAFLALSSAGVTPAGFVEQAKVREIQGVLDHMHIREDQYRKALKELQEALDANEGDKKKALRNLKKTRLQLELLEAELSQLQTSPPAPRPSGGAQLSNAGLHTSVGILMAAVWWFYQQDIAGLQRKLLTVFLLPLCWVYVTMGIMGGATAKPFLPLYCLCWFLIGFIAAHGCSS